MPLVHYRQGVVFPRSKERDPEVVAQYRGVDITVGLPFVRTSVDHGTAFDIAGKGIAAPASLAYALKAAIAMTAA